MTDSKRIIPITKDDAKDLKWMVKHTDPDRDWLGGIHVYDGLCIATNGLAMVAAKLHTLNGENGLMSVGAIPASGGDVVFANEDESGYNQGRAQFPSVIPDAETTTVYVDAQRLAKILARFYGMVRIDFAGEKKPIEVSSNNGAGAQYALLMAMRPSEDNKPENKREMVRRAIRGDSA